MAKKLKNGISPSREEDFSAWYQQVIKGADLAENSVSRGCMIIKPWGYAIWERIQRILDDRLKETGHVNAYFPLLVPLSLLEKEAEHIDGFAKECAVVTHSKLENSEHNELQPVGPLEEPYVIRPTSETIIGESYARWVQSYRDLPIMINQWANVMRWEMRPRLFLRTSEFLWQEGHTVHATKDGALEETHNILKIYEQFAKEFLAIPVLSGKKTPDEKFPGAVETHTIEAMMQDGKAVQAGTSHFLGQKFAKASNIKFQNELGETKYAWSTSWGVSTRLIGALIMTHSDDDGLVLPPKISPQHVVIQPIYKDNNQKKDILNYSKKIIHALRQKKFMDQPIYFSIDSRDIQGGEKEWDNIRKGIPIRLDIGINEVSSETVCLKRRDMPVRQKECMHLSDFIERTPSILTTIQENLYQKAEDFRDKNTKRIENLDDFQAYFNSEGGMGFAIVPWCKEAINHKTIKQLKLTPRCIPANVEKISGKCIFTNNPATDYVIFAKSY